MSPGMVSNYTDPRYVMDRRVGNYRVVSTVAYDGSSIDIPDDAVDVRVEPLAQYGATRVTYRQPLREVRFEDRGSRQPYFF